MSLSFVILRRILLVCLMLQAEVVLESPVKDCRFEPGAGKDYQVRVHPLLGTKHMHTGVDLSAPEGTPYLAPGDGKVTFAGKKNNRCGYMIEIQHAPNLFTHSCHMKAGGFKVKVGDLVKRGQKVAEVGNTGSSRGAHSHFVVKRNAGFKSHMDPYKFVSSFCNVSRSQARGNKFAPVDADQSNESEAIQ